MINELKFNTIGCVLALETILNHGNIHTIININIRNKFPMYSRKLNTSFMRDFSEALEFIPNLIMRKKYD